VRECAEWGANAQDIAEQMSSGEGSVGILQQQRAACVEDRFPLRSAGQDECAEFESCASAYGRSVLPIR